MALGMLQAKDTVYVVVGPGHDGGDMVRIPPFGQLPSNSVGSLTFLSAALLATGLLSS
jgi:hypothetical protein